MQMSVFAPVCFPEPWLGSVERRRRRVESIHCKCRPSETADSRSNGSVQSSKWRFLARCEVMREVNDSRKHVMALTKRAWKLLEGAPQIDGN